METSIRPTWLHLLVWYCTNCALKTNDELSEIFDLTINPAAHQTRDRETIRDLLLMKASKKIIDPETNEADKVRQKNHKKACK